MPDFIADSIVSTTYVDRSGNVIDGYIAYITFPEFEETHRFNVPNIKTETIADVAYAFLEQRRALRDMASEG